MKNETTTRPTHDRTSAETDWIQSLVTTAYVVDVSNEEDARLMSANPAALEELGVTLAFARKRKFRSLAREAGRERVADTFRDCARALRAVPYEAYLTSGLGIAIPVAGRAGRRYVIAVELPDPASRIAPLRRMVGQIADDPIVIGLIYVARTLVRSLTGWTEAVKLQPAAGRESLQYVIEAATRVSELLDQITAGILDQPHTGDRADPNATISSAARTIKALVGAHITVTMNLAAETPQVRMSAERLTQVLLHLAAHSRDAMPDGGEFSIGTKPILGPAGAEWVAITASDTGVGIDRSALPKAFAPPTYADGTATDSEVGLWPVDRIVWEAGGEISVQSEPGDGTTIEVRLPPGVAAHPRD